MDSNKCNKVKNKKKRTRKELNEVRKRSRISNQDLIMQCKCIKHVAINNQSSIIANDRITLSIFPNSVRSDTITRPILTKLKLKPELDLDDLVDETNSMSKSSLKQHDLGGIHFCNGDKHLVSSELCPKKNDNKSMKDLRDTYFPKKLPTGEIDELGYSLYREFMSDIPEYFKFNTQSQNNKAIKTVEDQLKNIFIDIHCRGKATNRENAKIKAVTELPLEEILHSPTDYLLMSHLNHPILNNQQDCNEPSPELPLSKTGSIINFAITDTPDYTFYPHKLN